MSDQIHILETSFVKYLKSLPEDQRALHLFEALENNGEMAFELCDYLKDYDIFSVAKKIENIKEGEVKAEPLKTKLSLLPIMKGKTT